MDVMITQIHFLGMGVYDLSQSSDGLPKGMILPEAPGERRQIPLLCLGQVNYVAMIYEALEAIPVELRVTRCVIREDEGQMPEVRLVLHIMGVKEAEQIAPEISD